MDASEHMTIDEIHALQSGSPALTTLLVGLGSTLAGWTVAAASAWLRGTSGT